MGKSPSSLGHPLEGEEVIAFQDLNKELKEGSRGTILRVSSEGKVFVKWDGSRSGIWYNKSLPKMKRATRDGRAYGKPLDEVIKDTKPTQPHCHRPGRAN